MKRMWSRIKDHFYVFGWLYYIILITTITLAECAYSEIETGAEAPVNDIATIFGRQS